MCVASTWLYVRPVRNTSWSDVTSSGPESAAIPICPATSFSSACALPPSCSVLVFVPDGAWIVNVTFAVCDDRFTTATSDRHHAFRLGTSL